MVRHTAAAELAAVALVVGCGSEPVGPQPQDTYVEVHVTGGFVATDYRYALVGSSSEVRGIACVQGCDFEPGDVLADLTPAQVAYYADLLIDAGIHAHDGKDFGNECCDQFHYVVEYRDGERTSTMRGAAGNFPADLGRAINELQQTLSGVLPVIIDWASRPEDWPQDPLVLRQFSLEGGILELEVEYGGGCKSHDHDLVAWGGWMETVPVQVHVLLTHEDPDDPCDALIRRTLRYDLTRLREDYEASYPNGGPTTIVLLLTVPDGAEARPIEYTF
jgi:hypothetical protein